MSIHIHLIPKSLSTRISLMVVSAIALLLSTALFVMFAYSRKVMKEEATQNAQQTLEAAVVEVDNVLLNVEQQAGNIYADMMMHLAQPDRMIIYSRKIVEGNPNVAGCAIAMEPNFYPGKPELFMAYVYRTSADSLTHSSMPIIQKETFGNKPYNEQIWYTAALNTGRPCWINPLKNEDTDGEAIVTFSLPIYNFQGRVVGVVGVDVSLTILSNIVLSAKPSPHSYATLLGSDGSFIVHPDTNKLLHETVFTQLKYGADPTVGEAARAMIAGENGHKRVRINGEDCYVFYKPFKQTFVPGRSMSDLGWRIGIIYPANDIFGDYKLLLYIVLIVAIAGLLLLLVLCRSITHHLLLPLRLLGKSAQSIAEGNFSETIPQSKNQDEVGQLQNHFRQMQLSLSTKMDELQQLTEALNEQGKVLSEAYEQGKEADRMKIAFLHNMTNQMTVPVDKIKDKVDVLCLQRKEEDNIEGIDHLVDDIEQQGHVVTDLLDDLIKISNKQ